MTRFDDETLMAYADGVLDEPRRSAVARAAAGDSAIAERIAAMTRARELVRELHAPLADSPVPRALSDRVAAMVADHEAKGATIVRLADRRVRRPLGLVWPVAAAAAVAALVAGPVGFMLARPPAGPGLLAVAQTVPPPYADVLATLPSGESTTIRDAGQLKAIATFRDASGQLCREFEVDRDNALVVVACREAADWRVTFAVEAPLADGYAPASSLAALDAYLEAIDAGAPMSKEEETASLGEFPASRTE